MVVFIYVCIHLSTDHFFRVYFSFLPSVVDCGFLADPNNGEVHFTTTTFGSVAEYTCTGDCEPVGDYTRMCTAEGLWSGIAPQCPGTNILQAYSMCVCFYSLYTLSIMHYTCDYMY